MTDGTATISATLPCTSCRPNALRASEPGSIGRARYRPVTPGP